MKLLTQELIKRFEQVGSQEWNHDPLVIAKFFHPFSSRTWFATEYDPENEMFFGIVIWAETEFGNFSLQELEEIVIAWIPMERDRGFEKRCSEIDWLREFISLIYPNG